MAETCLSEGPAAVRLGEALAPIRRMGRLQYGVMMDNALDFAYINDRCPVILEPGDRHTWRTAPLPDLYWFDRPYSAEAMFENATAKPWAER